MKAALLIIDVQNDYLNRAGLSPSREKLIESIFRLLNFFRSKQLPVFHVHTLIYSDGANRMPHWKRQDIWACIEATGGAQPPDALTPGENEHVISKAYYSAFASGELHNMLSAQGVGTLIVSGIYTHACIRQTALDAYEKGYNIIIVDEAIGSTDVLHATLTKNYLADRCAEFVLLDELLTRLGKESTSETEKKQLLLPVAFINGKWLVNNKGSVYRHDNPASTGNVCFVSPVADRGVIDEACANAHASFNRWQNTVPEARMSLLSSWKKHLSLKKEELQTLMINDVGKPIQEVRAELEYANSILESVLNHFHEEERNASNHHNVYERRMPVGVISVVTPWNNPVAIPVGKLAPAILYGNTVVWKPAQAAARISQLLIETLVEAGLPPGVVNVVSGDAGTAQHIAASDMVHAVTLTGSTEAGRNMAMLCAIKLKPVQAELGGNNAALIMRDCDLDRVIPVLIKSSFSFSGQRCTALRRYIVDDHIYNDFISKALDEVNKLNIGYPQDEDTDVGPVISQCHRDNLLDHIEAAMKRGAKLLTGGRIPDTFTGGNWLLPTLIQVESETEPLFQQESFGPVVVIMRASGLDHAIRLNNAVSQGLLAVLYSAEPQSREIFCSKASAGILRINPWSFGISPAHAFGGWNDSGLGQPEHGAWDREFYSRPQTIYL